MNNSLNLALAQASRKLSVDVRLVEAIYRSYWGFIRNRIEGLSLTTMTEDEFNSVEHNFNIPYIGKLYVDYEKIEKYKRHKNYIQNVKAKENQADRLPGVSD